METTQAGNTVWDLTKSWPSIVLRSFCVANGALFILAGLSKIQQPYDFLSGVYSYQMFDEGLGLLVAMIVPPLEIVAGLALLSRTHMQAGLLVSVLLTSAFILVRGWVVRSGIEVECNCFGAQSLLVSERIDLKSLIISTLHFAGCVIAFAWSLRNVNRK